MPYAKIDAWHRHMREFEKDLGKVKPGTIKNYRSWFEEAYRIVGEGKDPSKLTKEDLRKIELETHGNENSLAIKLREIRYFLRCCGCKPAQQWKILYYTRPSINGVFLKEAQLADARGIAQMLGIYHELIFSLTMDMGLRPVDALNLTKKNANEFLYGGGSEILGKGKNGGKRAYQQVNTDTLPVLSEYMKLRVQLVKMSGTDPEQLLIMQNRRCLKTFKVRGMTYDDVYDIYVELREETGIPFTPKDGRKTCGNRLSYVADLPTVAILLRHENPNTSFKHYIGRTKDDLAAAMGRLNPSSTIQQKVSR